MANPKSKMKWNAGTCTQCNQKVSKGLKNLKCMTCRGVRKGAHPGSKNCQLCKQGLPHPFQKKRVLVAKPGGGFSTQQVNLGMQPVPPVPTAPAAPPPVLHAQPQGVFLGSQGNGLGRPPSVPVKPDEYIPANGEYDDLRDSVQAQLNVLLVGPSGCGKTHAVHALAYELQRPLVTIQGGEGATPEHLIGYREIRNVNGVPVTTWVDGLIPYAMRHGAMLYIDEPNAFPDGIRFYLFSAMDFRREITLAENGGEVVHAAPGFTVIGAMNEGKGYTGTSTLNIAFRDRFDVKVYFEYLPENREKKLIKERTGIDEETAKMMLKVVADLRASYSNNQLNTPISTRSFLSWARLTKMGRSPQDAARLTLVNSIPSTYPTQRVSVAQVVENYFANAVKETSKGK
jgi:MoxR-like ATPase